MSLETTIVDPEKVAWKGNATQVVLAISDGLVGILPGHADAVFAIEPCIAKVSTGEGPALEFFLSGGIARMEKGILTIVADSAETSKTIDRTRAERAMRRAKERLSKASRDIDYERARLALSRALHRLEIAS